MERKGVHLKCGVSMELHFDASIDKLAINVQLDKEKYMEKEQRQTEPERAEAERVEAGSGT